MHPRIIYAQEGVGDPDAGVEAQRRLILLYGYWPPTDIGVQSRLGMLDSWKTRARYKNSNYDVLAIAPEFTARKGTYDNGNQDFWGKGTNRTGADPLTVDYRETSTDFWGEVAKYKPIAIMSFSRGTFDHSWVLEPWATNWSTNPSKWTTSIAYTPDNQADKSPMTWDLPFVGGGTGDPSPYGPGKPLAKQPKDGDPPDPTQDKDTHRDTTLPTDDIVKAIKAVLNQTDVDPTNVNGNGPGDFVSNFMAYHVAWWKAYSNSSDANFADDAKCKAAGHTHVGGKVTVANGKIAVEAQLDAMVNWLDKN